MLTRSLTSGLPASFVQLNLVGADSLSQGANTCFGYLPLWYFKCHVALESVPLHRQRDVVQHSLPPFKERIESNDPSFAHNLRTSRQFLFLISASQRRRGAPDAFAT
jgi:hypothetical protein